MGQHHFSPEFVIKKPNRIEHVSTEGDIYLVWLVITKWIGSPSTKVQFGLFFWSRTSKIFGEKWWCSYKFYPRAWACPRWTAHSFAVTAEGLCHLKLENEVIFLCVFFVKLKLPNLIQDWHVYYIASWCQPVVSFH